jgi:hypothetical protein
MVDFKKGDRIILNADIPTTEFFKKGRIGIVKRINNYVNPPQLKVVWEDNKTFAILGAIWFDIVPSNADKIKEIGDKALKILEQM